MTSPDDPRAIRLAPSVCASLLLAIETAGSRCSVAVVRGDAVLAAESQPLRHGHAEALFPMIGRVMEAAGLRPSQLDIVAAAVGPGGFTGIRVGVAAAHGIALAVGARLVGVTGFAAVAAQVAAGQGRADNALLVVLDSRRDDFYVQLFASGAAEPLAPPRAVLPDHLAEYVAGAVEDAAVLIAGDAAEAASAAFGRRSGVAVAADTAPDARGVAVAALRQQPVGPAERVRPLYLRPPDVTLPRQRTSAGLAP